MGQGASSKLDLLGLGDTDFFLQMSGVITITSKSGTDTTAEMVGPAAVDQRTCVSERLGDEQYHRQTITYDHQRRKTQTQPRCR